MTEQGTKALIGAFVLSALALLAAGVILIGSGSLSRQNVQFVLYFPESLRGLVPGSPVHFKGVRVGKVASLQIVADQEDLDFHAPVIIELESKFFTGPSADPDLENSNFMGDRRAVEALIRRGLRARLGMLSFITGQLTVDLDIMPEASPAPSASLPSFRGLQQIPTVPSSLNALFDSLDHLPLEELTDKLMGTLDSFQTQLAGMDLPALTASLVSLSGDLRGAIAGWDGVSDQARATLDDYASLARNAENRISSTLRQLDATLENLSSLARSSRQAMDRTSSLLSEDSAPMLELSQAMQALREASLAVTNLATLLELRPESLLFGRTP